MRYTISKCYHHENLVQVLDKYNCLEYETKNHYPCMFDCFVDEVVTFETGQKGCLVLLNERNVKKRLRK